MKTLIVAILAILMFLPSLAFAQPLAIKLVDNSTPYADPQDGGWDSSYYDFSKAALQNQMNAVEQFYHQKTGIVVYGFGEKAPSGAWPIYIDNKCTWEGIPNQGYHWIANGIPYACIASVDGGGFWWMTRAMEHEATEAIGDPSGTGFEIVDPVASYVGGVDVATGIFQGINNYSVSTDDWPFVDFIIPAGAQKKYGYRDYLKQLKAK